MAAGKVWHKGENKIIKIEEIRFIMFNVYFWNARYKKGEDIVFVGAESKEAARKILDESLSKYDFNGGIEAIIVFEQIPKVTAQERGILEVF